MTWWAVLIFLLLMAIPVFFLWTTLHEMSHWVFAKAFVPLKSSTFTLWPHVDKGTFFWARVQWTYADRPLTEDELAWTLFAPRWMNLLAALLFPLGFLFGGWGMLVWLTLWGGGLIDLVSGSIDRGDRHDMSRYSQLWGLNPWIFRIGGCVLALTSAILGVTLALS